MYAFDFCFQRLASIFQAFPKIQMVHAFLNDEEIFDFEINLLPKSLTSFQFVPHKNMKDSQFLRRLFGGLKSLSLNSILASYPPDFALLPHCTNLPRLVLFHHKLNDYSFLRCMPHLKHLATFSDGCRVDDVAMISREAPNLVSLAIDFPDKLSVGDSRVYFKDIGREICSVKNLMLYGTRHMLEQFLHVFSSNHSLFCQVTSVRYLEDLVRSVDVEEDLILSFEPRPQCTISQIPYFQGTNPQTLCDLCWERRKPNWMCPRCESFVMGMN
jgi:hypothetical protein